MYSKQMLHMAWPLEIEIGTLYDTSQGTRSWHGSIWMPQILLPYLFLWVWKTSLRRFGQGLPLLSPTAMRVEHFHRVKKEPLVVFSHTLPCHLLRLRRWAGRPATETSLIRTVAGWAEWAEGSVHHFLWDLRSQIAKSKWLITSSFCGNENCLFWNCC